MEVYYYWLIVAVVFVIIEIATVSFGSICFSVGALASGLTSYLGASFSMQLGVFAVVSFVAFLFLRPLLMKWLNSGTNVMTNADAIIGRKGVVSEPIDAQKHTGRVRIDGDDWKAVSEDVIDVGSEVEVISRDSIIITVKKL